MEEDSYESDETIEEEFNFQTDDELFKYQKRLLDDVDKYELVIMELEQEKAQRDLQIKELQIQIERSQMQISHYNHEMHKVNQIDDNILESAQHANAKAKREDVQEDIKLDAQVTKHLTKYINRSTYQKKIEYDGKLEKKINTFRAVCVKYYKNDPTNEEYGLQRYQTYSYQVFGLSNYLRFHELFDLAVKYWNIPNKDDYVLTDQDHHDMKLLDKTYITQFLAGELHTQIVFILRPRNTGMKELMSSQKANIMDGHESDKTNRIKDEFSKIFETVRKAKPGITTYQKFQDPPKERTDLVDSTFSNLVGLLAIFILIIISLVTDEIQPFDRYVYQEFNSTFSAPNFFSSGDSFNAEIPSYLYDINDDGTPAAFHFIPIGGTRIIMNKMKPLQCHTFNNQRLCSYEDEFTNLNKDTEPLKNTTKGPWKYYTHVPKNQQINIHGEFSFFDGSGYIADIPNNITIDQAKDYVDNVLMIGATGNYFSLDSRAYIFYSTFFEPNRHIILERTTLFEFASSGVVQVTDRKNAFKPHSFENNLDESRHDLDLALLIITILVYSINVGAHIIRTKTFLEVFRIRNLTKYLTMALVIAYYILYYHELNLSAKQILESDTFYAVQEYGDSRQSAVVCLTCAVFVHSLVIINSFAVSRTINAFLSIFSRSYKDFLAFLTIFLVFFIGINFVWWIIFSPYIEGFHTWFSTIFEIFQFFVTGDTLIITRLFYINPNWSIILVIFTCYVIFIQMDALMMSLIQENVRYLYLKDKQATNAEPAFKATIRRFVQRIDRVKQRAQKCIKSVTFRRRRAPPE